MKDKEKKQIKKTKKSKKPASSVKKKKAKGKKSVPASKKSSSSARKASGKVGTAGKGSDKAPGSRGRTGKVASRVSEAAPSDRSLEQAMSAAITDELDGVIIHEDGTVSFPKQRGDAELRPSEDEFLMFRLAGKCYAIMLSDVHEILRHQRITRVPRAGSHVIGATSLRGAIVPVVNLSSMLSLKETTLPDRGRILLLKGKGVLLGLLVERGIGISNFSRDDMKPPFSSAGAEGSMFVEGVFDLDGEFFSVLSPDALTRTNAIWRINETEA